MHQRLYHQFLSLDRRNAAGKKEVVAVAVHVKLFHRTRRRVQHLGGDIVVLPQPASHVVGNGVDAPAGLNRRGVLASDHIPQCPAIRHGGQVRQARIPQVIGGPVLVQYPQRHFGMGYEPHGEFQGDDPVYRHPVEVADIHQPGSQDGVGQGLLGVPFERQRQYFRPVARGQQLRPQVLRQHLGPAIAKRDLSIQYQYIHAITTGDCLVPGSGYGFRWRMIRASCSFWKSTMAWLLSSRSFFCMAIWPFNCSRSRCMRGR